MSVALRVVVGLGGTGGEVSITTIGGSAGGLVTGLAGWVTVVCDDGTLAATEVGPSTDVGLSTREVSVAAELPGGDALCVAGAGGESVESASVLLASSRFRTAAPATVTPITSKTAITRSEVRFGWFQSALVTAHVAMTTSASTNVVMESQVATAPTTPSTAAAVPPTAATACHAASCVAAGGCPVDAGGGPPGEPPELTFTLLSLGRASQEVLRRSVRASNDHSASLQAKQRPMRP